MSLHGGVVLTPDEVLKRGLKLVGFTNTQIGRVQEKKNQSRYRTHYGAHPVLLTLLQETTDENARLELDTTSRNGRRLTLNRLWIISLWPFTSFYATLLRSKQRPSSKYATKPTDNGSGILWRRAIALLKDEVICWPESWNNADNKEDPISQIIFAITVDGTHCHIEEPTHEDFSENPRYFSHKLKCDAYDYEIAISIFEGRVVWAARPYPPGTNDITIFRHKLKDKILESQGRSGVQHRAIGDKGYRGEREIVSVPSSHDKAEVRTFKSRALARHETFNARMKNFDCLEDRFRHTGHPRRKEVSGAEVKHQWCFNAVLVICQLQLEKTAFLSFQFSPNPCNTVGASNQPKLAS
jgi:hypothetical protein